MSVTLNQYENELIELIYQIPLKSDGWGEFCNRMISVLHCSSVQVLAFDIQHQAYSFSRVINTVSESETAQAEVAYLHYPVEADPRWSDFLNPARQGWYQCHHHSITDEFVANSDLYQDVLLPVNIRYTSAHELLLDDKLCVLIAVHTSIERKPLTQPELDFLDRLLVHLKRVTAIQRHIYEFSTKAIMGYALVDKLSQPIMLLDFAGTISHYNIAAQQLLNKSQLINIDEKKLVLPEPYQSLLTENLKQIEFLFKTQKLDFDQKIEDGCIKILDENGETLYIFASLLVSEQEMKAFGIRPLVMLTFYHPNHTSLVDAHLLHAAFGLTPVESKVALLLLEGFLPKEVAQKHGVSLDTVRKHLKSIFKKTATNRQAELVRLLLNMPRHILNN